MLIIFHVANSVAKINLRIECLSYIYIYIYSMQKSSVILNYSKFLLIADL